MVLVLLILGFAIFCSILCGILCGVWYFMYRVWQSRDKVFGMMMDKEAPTYQRKRPWE